MNRKSVLWPILALQIVLGVRVIWRFMRSAGGDRILPREEQSAGEERVSVIVPVLNEINRLAPCLDGLIAQGREVAEIVVVDGGSTDGTQELVASYCQRDARLRLVDASPVPSSWNGKAWGLQVGLQSLAAATSWVLTVDADVRPQVPLVRALLGRARNAHLSALSVATQQELSDIGEGMLHPALLTTIVYRFGIPGKTFQNVRDVQANGQCFLFRRGVLEAIKGFSSTRHSLCEDVTIARLLVKSGYRVGFYEAGSLAHVNMYVDWRDLWFNWPRSLPMHDQFSGLSTLTGWLEIVFVQALPLPLLVWLLLTHPHRRPSLTGSHGGALRETLECGRARGGVREDGWPLAGGFLSRPYAMRGWRERRTPARSSLPGGFAKLLSTAKALLMYALLWMVALFPLLVNVALVAMRLGVLIGTARAYQHRPWTYWLSPLCDSAVALWLGKMALQRRHIWRGRAILRGQLLPTNESVKNSP